MKATVVEADLTKDGGVLVTFGDGTAAIFSADFLYAHREHESNKVLREDEPPPSTQL